MNKKRKLSFLLVFAMIVSLFSPIGTLVQVQAATPTWFEAYPRTSTEKKSENFELKVGGNPVDVVQYYEKKSANHNGYSYAHLAYEGTATFEIKCLKGNIEAVDASPHSYNMDVKINGNTFTFDLTQVKSRYMVFDVRANGADYQLIVAADPRMTDLEAENPKDKVDGVKVVSARNGMPSINVGGLASNDSKDNSAQGRNNTDKIQKIINELSKNGGGTLYFPAGEYPFVTLDAKSNVTIYLDKGATLKGSGIRTDYDWNTTGANGIQVKQRDVRIKNVNNFKIIGYGMIDANSIAVSAKGKTSSGSRELNKDPAPDNWYPDGWNDYRKGIVDGENSTNVEFKGVTFKDATGWTFNIRTTKNINMNNVKMLDDYTVVHSDGYDIVSCQDVDVQNCFAVCGDDGFCPKGDVSGYDMKNYLFKDGVVYAEGGAGCKIGVQARSNVSNIEFNNIDVIRGYRGFSIAHDEGEGNWNGIYFRNIRTEKLHIPSFSTSDANNYGQYTATPFTLWLRSNGSVKNVEVTNCSFESISNLRAMIRGNGDNGKISNVTFNNLTMEGRTVTSLDDARLSVGKAVDTGSFKFNNTEVHNPQTKVYEAEEAALASVAKAAKGDPEKRYSKGQKVGHLGLENEKEGTVTFTVNVDNAGEYDMEVYSVTKLARTFYVTVNDAAPQTVTCNGDGWTLQGRSTMKVKLNKGNNTIKFGNPYAAAPDLDKIEIVTGGSIFNPNKGTTGSGSSSSDILVDQPVSLTVERQLLKLEGSAKVNDSGNDSGLIGYLGGDGDGTATFHVQASKNGDHILRIYYATDQDRSVSVTVNNGTPSTALCKSNGSWTEAGDNPSEHIVSLIEGDNTIVIGGVNGGAAPNIDRIAISMSDADAQATVSAWIDDIPANVTADADDNVKEYIKAVKKVYDSLIAKDKVTNVSKLDAALEALEGRSFFEVLAETAETTKPAERIPDPKNPDDYHIGNLGGPNHGAVTFHASVEKEGERTLKIYYSTMGTRQLNVAVNGGNPVTLDAPSTGSWDVAGEIPLTMKVNLKAGDNTITFSGNGDGWAPNIDRIEIALTPQEIKDTVNVIIDSLPDAGDITPDGGKTDEQLQVRLDAVKDLYEGLVDKEGVKQDKLVAAEGALDGTAAAVEDVIDAIYAIGTVTLNSGTAIQSAKDKYEALTPAQKELVTNYNALVTAEEAYKELKDSYDAAQAKEERDRIAANAVSDSIAELYSQLETISLQDGDRIAAARDAYGKLSADQKALVENLSDLEAVERRIRELQAEADNKKANDRYEADKVIEAIYAIGEMVTLDSEDAITATRDAYEALTSDQKALVTNYNILEETERKLAQVKEEAEQSGQDDGKPNADKEAADVVVNLIYDIGTVTRSSIDAIDKAREAYDKLSEDQKNYVTNYEDLTSAEQKYAELQELFNNAEETEKNQIAADAVSESIKNLTGVGLKDKGRVEEADKAFKALSDQQKELVEQDVRDILAKAKEDIGKLESVAKLIAAIEDVTVVGLDQYKEEIQTARKAFDALDLENKTDLMYDSYFALVQAEAICKAMQSDIDAQEAQKVMDAIKAIGTVTQASEEAIQDAKAKYEALTPAQKDLVTNYNDLEDAETAYNTLKANDEKKQQQEEADKAAAKTVMDMIAGIGAVTLNSEKAIQDAKAAYEGLTNDQKKLVTNYDVLEAADESYQKQKEDADKKEQGNTNGGGQTGNGDDQTGNGGNQTAKTPAVGDTLTNPTTGEQYKVLTISGTSGTVEYKAPKNKDVKTVSIKATVKIDGITYKVTGIAKNAFKNCKKLTKATIGSNVRTIGASAFQSCAKLKNVTIGKNVQKIGKKAFYGDKKLATINIKTSKLTAKNVGAKAFAKTAEKAKVKVPKKKLGEYKKWLTKKGISRKATIKK